MIRRSLGILVALLICWTALQLCWLQLDERIVEGDVMGNVGAAELFRIDRWRLSIPRVLARCYREDFGEYPALFPALTGIAMAAAGVTDLDGDAPSQVGLLWSWLAVLATWALGLALAGPRVAWLGAALLMLSPLWTGMQRYLLLENGVCALIASAAAMALIAQQREGRVALWHSSLLWILAGLAAGAALLVKQTAILALAPLAAVGGLGLAWPNRAAARERGLSYGSAVRGLLGGPSVALGVAALIAAPWYLSQVGSHDGYLLRSMQANPDAVGPLHQLIYYPLVLLQLPYAPVALAALAVCALLAHRIVAFGDAGDAEALTDAEEAGHLAATGATATGDARRLNSGLRGWSAVRLLLTVVVLGILLLVLLPKKYPRLLVPLLPLIAVALACKMAQWRASLRATALAILAVSLIASSFALGPLTSLLSPTRIGLVDVDERCFQSWIDLPSRRGMDWAALLAVIEQAGGQGQDYTVGADLWPAPPCSHQTTHDLGQHLRLRARRSGLEAQILAGEDAFEIAGSWTTGPPDVLISDGPVPCARRPEACATLGELQLVGRLSGHADDWPLDLHVFRALAATR